MSCRNSNKPAAPPEPAGSSDTLAAPPPVVLPRTEVHEIVSHANNTRYAIQVSLPRRYAERTERFGLLVALDADYSFALVRNIVEHLSDRGGVRELIVVAVAYPVNDYPRTYRLNRTRDYTPFYSEDGYPDGVQKVSGGALAFQRFLADELLPWLESHYRLAPNDRGFIGHSYGGLFGAWTLLTRSNLFQRYVLVSPSLWYADREIFRLEEQLSATGAEIPAQVLIAVGSQESARMVQGHQQFIAALRHHAYRGLTVAGRVFEGETHDTVFPSALTWALPGMWSPAPLGGNVTAEPPL
jgi:uncharacterized protein